MEEKHGKNDAGLDDSESSTDEEEDDNGVLALGVLDEEFNEALQAIRSKDPRVYDGKTTFYTAPEELESLEEAKEQTKDKPMFLRDYHRENLLRAEPVGTDEGVEAHRLQEPTYAQQQDHLKNALVQEMHQQAGDLEVAGDSDDNDGFLVKKSKTRQIPGGETIQLVSTEDVERADQDPESFLSKFMSSKGWVSATASKLEPFESDDEEEDDRADAFEEAYNLRFEDPQGANEKLVSHARDMVAKYSVRKEKTTGRKKARELEQTKKQNVKLERQQEKARLRKLKIQEAEEKIQKIQDAAGLKRKHVNVEEWSSLLTEDWNDEQWEAQMKTRFGNDYYDAQEQDSDGAMSAKKNHAKKPKWDDDLDITDLVPRFAAEEQDNMQFSLSDDDPVDVDGNVGGSSSKATISKAQTRKHEARRQRRKIEQLVDQNLDLDMAMEGSSGKPRKHGQFRYRETSPLAFGLTAHDILLASDPQLNQFAGLKKMAAFRDAEKKKKDKRRLGKKARLREWRRETFGDAQGPQKSLQDVLREGLDDSIEGTHGRVEQRKSKGQSKSDDLKKKKKRKRTED